ncbi:MAG: ComF family protein [Bacteroidales bacterium]|nr:ComF family protein [Bacteroidales bacterium]
MREVEGKALKDIVQYGLKAVLDLLVPRRCIVCESALASSEKHLCRECLDDIPHTYYWLRKFNPMADKFNALIQEELERISLDGTHPYHEEYAYATALFFYRADSDYSHISRQLKYHSNIPAGKFFGQQLGARLARAEHLADVDAVIPIPLHWTRRWSRGYNQAEVIAREVATALGVNLRTDILERCRRTRTQTKLSIEGKAANVKGAFRVRPDIVQSSGSGTKKADASAISDLKHLLIIDDIFTTGSTALACYSALRDTFPPSFRISIATLGFVGEA